MADFSLDQMPAGMADRLAALKRPVAPSPAAPPAAQRPASPLDQMPAGMAARLAAVQQPSPGPAVAPPARPRLRPQQGGGIGGWFRGVAGSVVRGVAGAEDWFAGKQRSQPGFHLNPIDVGAQAAVDIGTAAARARRHPHPKAVQAGVQESWRDVGRHAIGAVQKGAAIGGQVLNDTFRVPAEPMQPVMTALQAGTEAAAKKKIAQHGRETPGEYFKEFGKGVFNQETAKKALHSLVERDIVNWSPMSTPGAPNLPLKRGSLPDRVTRFGIDLVANMLVDHQVGSRFGKGLRAGVGGGLKRAEQAGLMDLKIPKYGKSLREIQAGLDAEKAAQRHFGAARGAVAPIERQAVKAVEGARKANQRVVDLGVNLHGKGTAGQATNRFDEMVTHLTEAGDGKRARFPNRAAARQWIESHAADPAQAQALYQEVFTTAKKYQRTFKAMGEHLEQTGYLNPGTVKRLAGRYIPGMYHGASQHAPDIESWLLEMRKTPGALTAQGEAAALRAEQRLGSLPGHGAAPATAKGRTLETYEQRVAHGAEFQATPLVQRGIRQQARAAEVSGGLQNIAKDPALARPGFAEIPVRRYTDAEVAAAKQARDHFRDAVQQAGPGHPDISFLRSQRDAAERVYRQRVAAQAATPALLATAKQELSDSASTLTKAQQWLQHVAKEKGYRGLHPEIAVRKEELLRLGVELKQEQLMLRHDPTRHGRVAALREALDAATVRAKETIERHRVAPGETQEARIARAAHSGSIREYRGLQSHYRANPAVHPALGVAQERVGRAEQAWSEARRAYSDHEIPRERLQAAAQEVRESRAALRATRRNLPPGKYRPPELESAHQDVLRTRAVYRDTRAASLAAGQAAVDAARAHVKAVAKALSEKKAALRHDPTLERAVELLTRQFEEAKLRYKIRRKDLAGNLDVPELAHRRAQDELSQAGKKFARDSGQVNRIERELREGPPKPTRGKPFDKAEDEFRLEGEHFGPLEGMLVKKSAARVVHEFIHPRQDGPVEQFMHRWGQFFQRAHTVANPPVIGHHWRYASFVGAVKSAEKGLGFLDQAALKKGIEIARWQHGGGKATEAILALERNTRTFTPGRRTFLEGAGHSLRETALPPGGTSRAGRAIQGTKRVVNETIGDIIAHIEQSYKVALTEKLAPQYGWDKAAHLANEQIGDWSQTPRPVRTLQKYGVTPFAAPRLRSVPAVVKASFYHPDLALRRSGARVPVLAARAAGPEAQARQDIEPGSIAIPGLKDAQGRQKFMSRNPVQITPARDIGALGSGLMAPLAVPLEVAGNVDWGASYRRQQATPISPPGTPPVTDAMNRLGFAASQFTPAAVRAIQQGQAALAGRSGYRGRSAPKLNFWEVGAGYLSGLEFSTPETPREKAERGKASQAQNAPVKAWGQQRWERLQSHPEQARSFPFMDRQLATTGDVKAAFRAAKSQMRAVLTGHNLAPDEQRERLAEMQDYLVRLRARMMQLRAKERGIDQRLGVR